MSIKVENYYLLLAIFLLLLQKGTFIFMASPLPDEAYYWLWAKNPDLSYFDHPPFSIWLQSVFSIIIIDKILLIRIVPIICSIFFMFIMYIWTKALVSSFSFNVYLKNLAIALSLPILGIFLTISFPDCLIILCLSLSGFFFSRFLQFSENNKGRITAWYLSVFFFSLAILTKYNAVLFGIGIFIFLNFYSRQRSILFSRHFIIAIILIVAIQTPVIGWNIENEFSSFRFHLQDRLDFSIYFDQVLNQILIFLFGLVVSFCPFFLLGIISPSKKLSLNFLEDEQLKLATTILVSTLIFCFTLSLFITVQYYWALPAIVAFVPIFQKILNTFGRFIGLLIFGVSLNLILTVNYVVTPVSGFWGPVDRETALIFGWNQVINEISELKKKNNISNVLFSDYRVGSLYAFHSGNLDVDVFMKDRGTQFDLWRKERRSKQALERSIIMVDNQFPINRRIEELFKNIRFVKNIVIKEGSLITKSYDLYIASN